MRKFKIGAGKAQLLATVMAAASLGACSSDVARFNDDPFQNPFNSRAAFDPVSTNSISRNKSAAPQPLQPAPVSRATTQALPPPNQPIMGANRPLTTGSVGAANYPPLTASAPAPTIAGSPSGWSAIGGTPVTLQKGETVNTLSQRYNVPVSAIMAVNGLSSANQAQPGQQVMIPAYNAVSGAAPRAPQGAAGKGAAVISRAPQPLPKANAQSAAIIPPKPPRKVEPVAVAAARNVTPTPVSDAEKRAAAKLREIKGAKPAPDASALEAKKRAEAARVELRKAEAAKLAEAKKVREEAAAAKAARLAAARKGKLADEAITTASVDAAKVEPRAAAFAPAPEAEKPQAEGGNFRWPAKGRVISGFGARGTGGANDGINIAVPEGTPVRAAEGGTVVHADDALKGYGKLVLIRHPNGYVSVYAHNGELNVKRGESVKRGQVIAKAGQTGNVTAPQVHFEIRKGSTPVDPTKYLGE